jgi:hypothetical protein
MHLMWDPDHPCVKIMCTHEENRKYRDIILIKQTYFYLIQISYTNLRICGCLFVEILGSFSRLIFMSHGSSCHMVLHVTWFFMSHGSSCHMVLHVTWFFMSRGSSCHVVLHVPWFFMSRGSSCHVVLYVTWLPIFKVVFSFFAYFLLLVH